LTGDEFKRRPPNCIVGGLAPPPAAIERPHLRPLNRRSRRADVHLDLTRSARDHQFSLTG
jgi:hypothetical protein